MRVLDLFSGIGAFSLGLERAGMRTVAFCESDAYCRRVLAKHWPEIPCYDDVRFLTAERLRAAGISVDVICGGFPCQDISVAGRGAGINGERSGLWFEFARLIGEIRPRYALIENVAALLGRGLGDVLCDLAALGYDAEWRVISAADMGAPHRRERVWIVGYPAGGDTSQRDARTGGRSSAAWRLEPARLGGDAGAGGGTRHVADADRRGWREQGDVGEAARDEDAGQSGLCGEMAIPGCPRGTLGEWAHATTSGTGIWATEPDVGRVVDGPAAKVDRRKRLIALGNSLVPQIPEMIGRLIIAAEGAPA